MSKVYEIPEIKELDRRIRAGEVRGFRTQHRNIMLHLLHHSAKQPGVPCAVLKAPVHHLKTYINAINQLESRGLIKVNRNNSTDYLQWTLLSLI